MEKNLTDEVILLLLPLFFNKVNFENDKYNFLSFNEVIKGQSSFKVSNASELTTKDSMLSLFEEIDNYDFSDYLLRMLENVSSENESKKKTILVNFPSNIEQFKTLNNKLLQKGISISKVIVSNFESFENFEKVISNLFTCPFCFNSFEKSSCLLEDKMLTCPFDGNKVSLSFSQKFVKSFSEYYFKNSLGFAQSLSSFEEENELYLKPNIIPMMIPEVEKIEEFLINKISEII